MKEGRGSGKLFFTKKILKNKCKKKNDTLKKKKSPCCNHCNI